MGLTLEAVAVHAMQRDNGAKQLVTIGAPDPNGLTARARQRFGDYLATIEQRNETTGKARAAWWKSGEPPAELAELQQCAIADFGTASEVAMKRLFDLTPGAASEGLALFVRARRESGDAVLGCVKLKFAELHDVRYSGSTDPLKAVEDVDVDHILPQADQVLKAALVPNPSGASDLRVMDDQLRDPASHWLLFLDANPRPTEVAISRVAAAALTAGLKSETKMDDREAAAVVAKRLDTVATAKEPVAVEDFAGQVAADAGVEPEKLWAAAVEEEPEVEEEHYELTPLAVQKLTATYRLGEGIELKGPARLLNQRVKFVEGPKGGWLLQLPVAGPVRPDY